MIAVKGIRQLRKADSYDEVWAIVRSLKNPIAGVKQVTALSPSRELFWKYLELERQKQWNAKSFREIYVPQFLAEMASDPENYSAENPRKWLNELYRLDKAGKNICLVCFCEDETLCHRSIVAGLLQGAGCNVQTEIGNDYSAYYTEYLKLRKEKKAND